MLFGLIIPFLVYLLYVSLGATIDFGTKEWMDNWERIAGRKLVKELYWESIGRRDDTGTSHYFK